jgi:hypothetical protein
LFIVVGCRMNIKIVVVLGHAVFETHYEIHLFVLVVRMVDGIIGMSLMSGNEHWRNYRIPGLFSKRCFGTFAGSFFVYHVEDSLESPFLFWDSCQTFCASWIGVINVVLVDEKLVGQKKFPWMVVIELGWHLWIMTCSTRQHHVAVVVVFWNQRPRVPAVTFLWFSFNKKRFFFHPFSAFPKR